ncbi:TonB-dependent receptor [Duganella qianjiadongensis]|uniref:TonB-dependent receptor n=1 Tax=Duganella qianjiadongensis TaxID=2692176 RepID=A0ABW9VR90_9BURK|nr:TonB-dependent receptor [Duganella qianjiadongensis]MYM42117.1 TonB-dependent receptor [Duganella qianjiadongensis]
MKNSNSSAFIPSRSVLNTAIGVALCSSAWAQEAKPLPQLPTVTVIGEKASEFGLVIDGKNLSSRRFATNDTATLLDGVPGISLYSGGGVSSLPAINGLADDRLKITVDGMSITSACPNHMNPALSYIDPAALSQVNVYAGIVPVSQGGDSIGGAIAVKSTPPVFAKENEGIKTTGNFTAFERSNGDVNGVSLQANAATENFSIGYTGNTVDAGNYKDGKGKEVAASRYKVRNNTLKFATVSGQDLWTIALGWQDIPFQGYPNQSMDMTSNKSFSINASYAGSFHWGTVDARAFRQHVRHKMDVLSDKAAAAGFPIADSYMPMDTDAVDLGYSIIAAAPLNESQIVRFGHEFHRYTLNDWWPPLVGSMGMSPNTFWNVNGGRRDRIALFSELDTRLSKELSTQLGARVERVAMSTGKVQGYHEANAPFGDAYQTDSATFNAKNHKRNDVNWDLTASARYLNSSSETYDSGFSRKTRSPNMHERYTWSNEAMMAGLMNNWFGDLNSYVGNLNLKPEVAYSFKANVDWHDAELRDWQVKMSPFYTYVKDYINAVSNTSANPYNMSGILGRQSLTFANQNAYLYGVDISGKKLLGKAYGEWTMRASLSYTRGKTTNGENLYNIMPLNSRLIIDHTLGSWSNTLEAVFVGAKDKLNAVRAEQGTAGYSVANYRTSYKLNSSVKFDAGVDNIFNRQYDLPLGGLEYVSANMTNAPRPLRAMGRSVNIGISISY